MEKKIIPQTAAATPPNRKIVDLTKVLDTANTLDGEYSREYLQSMSAQQHKAFEELVSFTEGAINTIQVSYNKILIFLIGGATKDHRRMRKLNNLIYPVLEFLKQEKEKVSCY